jgi:hypothetical protein
MVSDKFRACQCNIYRIEKSGELDLYLHPYSILTPHQTAISEHTSIHNLQKFDNYSYRASRSLSISEAHSDHRSLGIRRGHLVWWAHN